MSVPSKIIIAAACFLAACGAVALSVVNYSRAAIVAAHGYDPLDGIQQLMLSCAGAIACGLSGVGWCTYELRSRNRYPSWRYALGMILGLLVAAAYAVLYYAQRVAG